jgi:hypothetical protein
MDDEPIIGGQALEDEAESVRAERDAAIERLRTALAASLPGTAPELIAGSTVADLEASYEAVRAAAATRQAQAPAIPAGAPGRLPPPPLSAFEKIRAGVGRLGSAA